MLIGVDDAPNVNAATQLRVYADQEDCSYNQKLNYFRIKPYTHFPPHIFKRELCKLNWLYGLLWANKHTVTAVIHNTSYEDVSSMLS